MRTWLEDAAAAGARLVVHAKARRVLVAGGRAVGVDAGPVQVRARAVVVAAGAIETPALLLRSGLANPNVGRGLRLHPATAVFGIFDEEIRPWEGRCRRSTRTSSASSTAATGSSTRPCRCIRRC